MITGRRVKVKSEEYNVYMSPVTGEHYIYAFDGITEEHTGRFPLSLKEVEHVFINKSNKDGDEDGNHGTGSNDISTEVSSKGLLEQEGECPGNEDEDASS